MAAADRPLLSLLAERDAGEGVPFSTAPSVTPGATPRPLLYDRDTRAGLARLKAAGLVEERPVQGEAVVFALTEAGKRKAGRRVAQAEDAPATASAFSWRYSVMVPAGVSALVVLVLRLLGL